VAEQGAFEPTWSGEIHDEWCRNLAERIGEDNVLRRRDAMDRAFPAAIVGENTKLVSKIQKTCRTAAHRKDAHVVATAVDARATTIVTLNIKDFAPAVLTEHKLKKQRPDAFLLDLLETCPAEVLAGVKAHRHSLSRTKPDVETYVAELAGPRGSVPRFAMVLHAHRDVI
jgi:hypothetical protein